MKLPPKLRCIHDYEPYLFVCCGGVASQFFGYLLSVFYIWKMLLFSKFLYTNINYYFKNFKVAVSQDITTMLHWVDLKFMHFLKRYWMGTLPMFECLNDPAGKVLKPHDKLNCFNVSKLLPICCARNLSHIFYTSGISSVKRRVWILEDATQMRSKLDFDCILI